VYKCDVIIQLGSASEYPGNKEIKILLFLLSLNQFIYKIDKPYYQRRNVHWT